MAAPSIILGDAKVTIHAVAPRVYEALLNPEDLKAWWSPEAYVEAALDGRYETTPPEGRQAGTIVALEAPRKITFTWPVTVGEAVLETTVTYELAPRGAETIVHVVHRAREFHPHDWNATWRRSLEALKAYLEADTATIASEGA